MIEAGEIDPVDFAVFADTGFEGDGTYRHLDWLEGKLGFPVHRVKASNPPHISGDLKADVLQIARATQEGAGIAKGRTPTIPAFTSSEKGRGILLRTCTETYKINPIKKKIREELGFAWHKWVRGVHVEQLFGISMDERQRMRISQDKWATFIYPLIDLKMTRADCRRWIQSNGFPETPRSACVCCPFRRDKEWREMKEDRPGEWAEAVEFDKAIRGGLRKTREKLFLHESLNPLDEVDFESGQREFSFGDECGGYCGV